MAQRVPASDIQASFTQLDERQAMRVLQRHFGIRKPGLNLFATQEANNIVGGRPQFGGGLFRRVERFGRAVFWGRRIPSRYADRPMEIEPSPRRRSLAPDVISLRLTRTSGDRA